MVGVVGNKGFSQSQSVWCVLHAKVDYTLNLNHFGSLLGFCSLQAVKVASARTNLSRLAFHTPGIDWEGSMSMACAQVCTRWVCRVRGAGVVRRCTRTSAGCWGWWVLDARTTTPSPADPAATPSWVRFKLQWAKTTQPDSRSLSVLLPQLLPQFSRCHEAPVSVGQSSVRSVLYESSSRVTQMSARPSKSFPNTLFSSRPSPCSADCNKVKHFDTLPPHSRSWSCPKAGKDCQWLAILTCWRAVDNCVASHHVLSALSCGCVVIIASRAFDLRSQVCAGVLFDDHCLPSWFAKGSHKKIICRVRSHANQTSPRHKRAWCLVLSFLSPRTIYWAGPCTFFFFLAPIGVGWCFLSCLYTCHKGTEEKLFWQNNTTKGLSLKHTWVDVTRTVGFFGDLDQPVSASGSHLHCCRPFGVKQNCHVCTLFIKILWIAKGNKKDTVPFSAPPCYFSAKDPWCSSVLENFSEHKPVVLWLFEYKTKWSCAM